MWVIRLSEAEINVEWTLKSMKEIYEKGDYFTSSCYSCLLVSGKVKEYLVAIKANNMMWQDGSGPVWVKQKVIYCDECAKKFMNELEEPSVTLE